MCKNLQCPSCSFVVAKLKDNKVVFDNMKAVSIIEFSLTGGNHQIKCHSCHNWLTIDNQNNISIDYKRKSKDALYSAENITFKKESITNLKNKRL